MAPLTGPEMSTLPAVLEPLRSDLERVASAYGEILAGVSWRTQDMLSQAARFNGKRLRPGLTCLAARMAGAEVTQDVATVAAIVELIHVATLVHDDVLDGADVRRRVATINESWGNEVAVLVGDVLLSRAFLASARLEDRFASRYLSEVVGETLEGEIHQDMLSRRPDLSEEDYRGIIRGKTAALYEGALVVGAHYGGDEVLGKTLGRFGHHLGMAFQIIDDRLDLSGDEATVGKSLGRDLAEGKTTLPVILWLRGRPEAERPESVALLEAAWRDEAAAGRLCHRLAGDGALEAADEAAAVEMRAALEALAATPASEDRDRMSSIAHYVIERRR